MPKVGEPIQRGVVGLQNLGNTCFMPESQFEFVRGKERVPEFQEQLDTVPLEHPAAARVLPRRHLQGSTGMFKLKNWAPKSLLPGQLESISAQDRGQTRRVLRELVAAWGFWVHTLWTWNLPRLDLMWRPDTTKATRLHWINWANFPTKEKERQVKAWHEMIVECWPPLSHCLYLECREKWSFQTRPTVRFNWNGSRILKIWRTNQKHSKSQPETNMWETKVAPRNFKWQALPKRLLHFTIHLHSSTGGSIRGAIQWIWTAGQRAWEQTRCPSVSVILRLQDSMELIEYVLDGLKEDRMVLMMGSRDFYFESWQDCNEVHGRKPYIELKEACGDPTQSDCEEGWLQVPVMQDDVERQMEGQMLK